MAGHMVFRLAVAGGGKMIAAGAGDDGHLHGRGRRGVRFGHRVRGRADGSQAQERSGKNGKFAFISFVPPRLRTPSGRCQNDAPPTQRLCESGKFEIYHHASWRRLA